jgi:hypothetical protein
MAHGKLRAETNCLNCNARVFGPYCHVCGQENRETRESAWDIVVHFFNDITHFEGKFITTLRYLLFRPGFLSTEYIRGRRSRYMNPIRMYVFTSAFFFLIFFFWFSPSKMMEGRHDENSVLADAGNMLHQRALQNAANRADSVKVDSLYADLRAYIQNHQQDTVNSAFANSPAGKGLSFNFGKIERYRSVADYDTAQHLLEPARRDGWLTRLLAHRGIYLRNKYGGRPALFFETLLEKFIHSFPQILFVSLPLVALIFWLLFRRRQLLYPQHLIFTIHYFIFVFLWLLVLFAGIKIAQIVPWNGWGMLRNLWWLVFFFYLYKAMRHFYGLARVPTLFKLLLFVVLAFWVNMLLFVLFFSYTLFNV